MICLEMLSDKWEEKLFEFELDNKDFFETMVPGRSKEYVKRESFNIILNDLINEQLRNELLLFNNKK